ncbi:multisubunit Na+/H+ antiporter MnhE subunit [Sphingomonas jejuensis]|uniref:Multisubunit Na+/H+ antiporter MnhE subunit n=1 Tax=Sphingomonas jejuensis TaxID=904715 RepID=A0ABX0XK52_9SPHN|nr:Na+/H+ antiporter subunit E [Sphingomonas jejuensis]NJC33732.1 multisubunit Na+/H+ antiporter MnhE subunit [Sphingomonas jejuensis]
MRLIRKAAALVTLAVVFAWDLVRSSAQVTAIVLQPRARHHPKIVAVPTVLEKDWSVGTLAYLTSLTPGSTCLHVSEDRRLLYIHMLDAPDEQAAIAKFQSHYEIRLRILER